MVGNTITLSLSARILVNVEALNMAESVGNVTRHRRAPIAVASSGRYSIVYVPAVSGESIAYHYQKLLADIAASTGLNVTEMDRRGYFLKFADSDIINSWYPEVKGVTKEQDPCRVEEALVRASAVADVTGFLYVDKLIKRTSRIRFSYLIPSLDAVSSGAAASYPQLHVRYAPPEALQRGQQREQALYYVESGSALYTLSSIFVASDVAKLEYCKDKAELMDEKLRRVEAALKALAALMDGLSFGAKRSRYLPVWDVRSMVVSVSKGPVEFIVSPGSDKEYIEKTLKRASAISAKLGVTVKAYVYDKEGLGIPEVPNVEVKRFETHTEALIEAGSQVLELLKAKS